MAPGFEKESPHPVGGHWGSGKGEQSLSSPNSALGQPTESQILHSSLKRSTCPPIPLLFFLSFSFLFESSSSPHAVEKLQAHIHCLLTYQYTLLYTCNPLREASPPTISFPNSASSHRFQQNPINPTNPSTINKQHSKCDPDTRPFSSLRPRPHCSPTSNPTAWPKHRPPMESFTGPATKYLSTKPTATAL